MRCHTSPPLSQPPHWFGMKDERKVREIRQKVVEIALIKDSEVLNQAEGNAEEGEVDLQVPETRKKKKERKVF